MPAGVASQLRTMTIRPSSAVAKGGQPISNTAHKAIGAGCSRTTRQLVFRAMRRPETGLPAGRAGGRNGDHAGREDRRGQQGARRARSRTGDDCSFSTTFSRKVARRDDGFRRKASDQRRRAQHQPVPATASRMPKTIKRPSRGCQANQTVEAHRQVRDRCRSSRHRVPAMTGASNIKSRRGA